MGSTRFTSASSEYSYSTSPPPGDVDYSAGGWVRFASRSNGMACFSIGPTSGDFPGSYDVIHLMGGSADYWGLTCAVGYAEANAFYGPSAVASDTWYHVMLVAEGSTTLLYVDGVQRVSVSHTRTSRVDAGHLRLGNSTVSWFTHLNGEMAGWKVWDRALTAGQVAAEAWSYMPVTTHNLRAAWPLLPGSRTGDWGGLALTLTEVNTPTDGTAEPPPIAFRRHVFTGAPAASGGASYTLTADSGTFTLTGTAADLDADRKLAAASGSFTLTGTAADLDADRRLVAASGTFALTGTDVSLLTGLRLTAESGTFTLTGTAADLDADRKLTAASATFTLTGTAADLDADRKLTAASGTFTLTGTAADLDADRKLTAASGTFTLTGTDVTLTYDAGAVLTAESASYVLTGTAVTLTYAPALTTVVTQALWGDKVTFLAGSEWRVTLTGTGGADAPCARVVLYFEECG